MGRTRKTASRKLFGRSANAANMVFMEKTVSDPQEAKSKSKPKKRFKGPAQTKLLIVEEQLKKNEDKENINTIFVADTEHGGENFSADNTDVDPLDLTVGPESSVNIVSGDISDRFLSVLEKPSVDVGIRSESNPNPFVGQLNEGTANSANDTQLQEEISQLRKENLKLRNLNMKLQEALMEKPGGDHGY
ncbi:uncharacterized protein LOC131687322 [Topomyia yanbarensis]|uniref:uncharacterized protein LOC131687322 n=1 Tax=Topomyia yanbarensis TaxID=2498891 RepID=UPI00273CD542|nr:uncharacterized protein LOC131687322 [Topomyia yanbarensis]